MSDHLVRSLTRLTAHMMLLLLLLCGAFGCRPTFDALDACESKADCFSNEICTMGSCVVGELPPATKPVKIVRFAASASEASADQEVTLSWEIQEARGASIASADGSFSYVVPAEELAAGSTTLKITKTLTLTLTATGEAEGDAATSTTKITLKEVVIPVINPMIDTFTASSTLIEPGASVTFSWSMVDVDRAELSNGETTTMLTGSDLQSGTLEVVVTQSANYTLTAYNETRSVMRAIQVVVQGQPPVISTFMASSLRVEQGSQVALSWSVAGATQLTLKDEAGVAADLSGLMIDMDTLMRTVSQNKTYTLTATNPSGEVSRTVSITTYEPLVIASFTVAPQDIEAGEQALLSWTVQGNPSSITITSSVDGMPLDLMGSSPAGGTLAVTVSEDTTYTLIAKNNDGDETMATATVAVLPDLPVIQLFDPSDTFVVAGSTVTLNWQVVGATTLTITDDLGAMVDLTGKMTDTDFVDVVITADRTYTLTASNLSGSVTRAVLIAVGEPVTTTLTSDVTDVNAGADVTLSWTTMNASSIAITSSLGETIDVTGKSVAADSVLVAPASDVTYTITAQGFAGPATATVVVTVNPIVQINSFTTSSLLINQGDTITLSWDIQNVTTYLLEAIDSAGTVALDTSAKGDVDSLMVSPTETTTYRLSAAGDMSDTDTVELTVVVEQPPVIDSFAATEAMLDLTNGPTTSTISWTTTNATQFTLLNLTTGMMETFTDLGNGAGEVDVTPDVTTDYLLSVGNGQGTFVTDTLTITVIP